MLELEHHSSMLSAKRKSDGWSVIAKSQSRSDGPFVCPECRAEVILRTGTVRVHHFAHKTPTECSHGAGETSDHRRCKLEIYDALQKVPGVRDVALERSFTTVRPDVFAYINNAPVAIEVQISVLSPETIIHRTMEYARKGIYVLWLLQWTPYLDGERYSPRLWEKWVHAAYFGRVYYWIKGLTVACYHFDPHYRRVSENSWYSEDGKRMSAGGYSRRSKRYRTAVRGKTFNLARDFAPRKRNRWEGNGLTIPAAKLYTHRDGDTRPVRRV